MISLATMNPGALSPLAAPQLDPPPVSGPGPGRWRKIAAGVAFAATFGWLLAPEVKASPAVLWPSAMAVGLAFVTRDIYLSLFLGALSGAVLLHHGNLWLAIYELLTGRLIPALTDRWNISVLIFTLLMGGFVEILNCNGGMTALAGRVVGRSRSPRRAALGAYLMGWLIFIDGLASSMLVGKTLRSVADRAGLSREKLSFIVDSTSSPVAGLALLSTWVAYEMSVIRQGVTNTGDAALAAAVRPFSWLVLSLPFRFYNVFMLLLVFLIIWLMRDWGPMLEAEQASRQKMWRQPANAAEGVAGSHAALALIPLTVLVAGVFGGLVVGGGGFKRTLTFPHLVQAMGQADAATVFVVATAAAAAVAWALTAFWSRIAPAAQPFVSGRDAFLRGMQQMFLPALILVFAWMLNSVIKELGTAGYLVSLLGDRVSPAWLPALVFLLSATVSFSTGTSWGTMAIIMPLAIPLAVRLTSFHAGLTESPVLTATVGAVLAGAVFGDHCSPISDTTIVSAFSSDCDVMAHVRTQLPYALTAAWVAVVCGYLPAGYGAPSGVLLAAGALACWLLVRYRGKQVEEPGKQTAARD
jgi:Na+/H+ antiporter NhaC